VYVGEGLDLLKVSRVDHGVRSMEDPLLVKHLAQTQIPLTVCPLSNVRLRVVDRMADHPLKRMMEAGLRCTVNSDDPAYFGGYAGDNFSAVRDGLQLTDDDLVQLARNSFTSSFIDEESKQRYLGEINGLAAAI